MQYAVNKSLKILKTFFDICKVGSEKRIADRNSGSYKNDNAYLIKIKINIMYI